MTLGEFRKYTKNMSDDVVLEYHHAGGYFPINTFAVSGEDTLVMCASRYGESHSKGILEAIVFLNKK